MVKEIMSKRMLIIREMFDFTQESFAEFLGISYNTYKAYEQAKNPIPSEIIAKISDKTGISSDFVLGINDNMNGDIKKYNEVFKKYKK